MATNPPRSSLKKWCFFLMGIFPFLSPKNAGLGPLCICPEYGSMFLFFFLNLSQQDPICCCWERFRMGSPNTSNTFCVSEVEHGTSQSFSANMTTDAIGYARGSYVRSPGMHPFFLPKWVDNFKNPKITVVEMESFLKWWYPPISHPKMIHF